MHNVSKLARHTLKTLQQMLQDFKVCLTILGNYALKGETCKEWVKQIIFHYNHSYCHL